MTLIDKILKNSTIDLTSTLEDSVFFNEREMIPTTVPMVNVALSGRIDGGLTSGVTTLAGESKNFKTGFALFLASTYLKKYEDAVLLFYDSEFGSPKSYFETFNIDPRRMIHTPVTDVEELKHDSVTQLKNIERGDKVVMVIDSIGNIASIKEVSDALEGKSVADMSRAKQIKSLFRMITPHGGLKDIPIIVVNHTYKEIGLYPKDIVSGGTGNYYSSDTIWIVGRRQEKDGTDLTGFNFVINIEKSRFVKEKSKIPISVSFDKGIQKWAGMFDVALELGYIVSPTKGFYALKDSEEKFRRASIEYADDFWESMINNTDLSKSIEQRYRLSSENMV